MADDLGLFATIGADDSGFQATFGRLEKTLDGWGLNLDKMYEKGSSFFKGFGVDIDQFAGNLGIGGAQLAAFGTIAITVGKQLFDLGTQFDSVNEKIAKGTGATGEKLQQLNTDFKDLLSRGIEQNMQDVGQAFADLNTKWGLSGEPLKAMTQNMADFADVTNQSATQAVAGVTDLVNKWGISLDRVPDLLDQLTVASQNSGVSSQELSAILTRSGTQLQAFGLSLTDATAMFAYFGKQGVNTTSLMMGLNQALAQFSAKGIDAAEGFKKAVNEIQNAKNPTEAMSIAVKTFGQRAGPELANALLKGKGGIDDFKSALINAGGAVQNTDKAAQTLEDKITSLKNKLAASFGPLGDSLVNVAKGVIDFITQIFDRLAPIIKPIVQVVSSVVNSIVEIFGEVTSAGQGLGEDFDLVYKTIQTTLQAVADWIKTDLGNIVTLIKNSIGLISALMQGDWSKAWTYTKLIVLQAVKVVLDNVSAMVNGTVNVINVMIRGINTALGVFGVKIPEMAQVALSETSGINKAIQDLTNDLKKNTTTTLSDIGKGLETHKDTANTVTADIQKKRDDAEKEYQTAIAATQTKLKLGLSDAQQATDDTKTATLNYINKLIDLGDTGSEQLKKLIDKYNELNGVTALAGVLATLSGTQQERFYAKKMQLMESAEKKEEANQQKQDQYAIDDQEREQHKYDAHFKNEARAEKQSEDNARKQFIYSADAETLDDHKFAAHFKNEEKADKTAQERSDKDEQRIIDAQNIEEHKYESHFKNEALADQRAEDSERKQFLYDTEAQNRDDHKFAAHFKNEEASDKRADDAAQKQAARDIDESYRTEHFFDTKFKLMEQSEKKAEENAFKQDQYALEDQQREQNKFDAHFRNEARVDDALESRDAKQNEYAADEAYRQQHLYEAHFRNEERTDAQAEKRASDEQAREVELDNIKQHTYDVHFKNEDKLEKQVTARQEEEIRLEQFHQDQMTKKYMMDEAKTGNNYEATKEKVDALTLSLRLQTQELKKKQPTQKEQIENLVKQAEAAGVSKEEIDKLRQAWNDFNNESQKPKLLETFAGIAASVSTLAYQIDDKLGSAINKIGGVLSSISNALIQQNPVAWIGAAVSVFDFLISLFQNKWTKALREANKALAENKKLFTDAGQAANAYTAVLTKVRTAASSFYESMQNIGTDIANALVDNFVNGLTESDFMTSMKKYITDLVIKTAVFTDSLTAQIADIGQQIASAISSGVTGEGLKPLIDKLKALYQTTSTTMAAVTDITNTAFAGYAGGTDYSTAGIHKVGEQGPGLINLPQGAKVLNANETSKTLSGNTVNNYNFNSPKELSPYEMRRQLRLQNRQMAFNGGW